MALTIPCIILALINTSIKYAVLQSELLNFLKGCNFWQTTRWKSASFLRNKACSGCELVTQIKEYPERHKARHFNSCKCISIKSLEALDTGRKLT